MVSDFQNLGFEMPPLHYNSRYCVLLGAEAREGQAIFFYTPQCHGTTEDTPRKCRGKIERKGQCTVCNHNNLGIILWYFTAVIFICLYMVCLKGFSHVGMLSST